MRQIHTPFLVVVSAVLLGGCGGGDGSTGPGSNAPLTRAEIVDMMSAMTGSIVTDVVASAASGVGPSGGVSLRSVAAASVQGRAETVPCPDGGSIVVTLSTDGSSAIIQHRGCKAKGESGQVWTMDGDPSLNVRFGIGSLGPSTTGIGIGMTGAIRASGAGKSTRCAMDVSVTSSVPTMTGGVPQVTGSITGTVCGVSVDETF